MRHAPLPTTEPAGPSINRLRSVLSAPFPHGRDDLSEEEEEEDVKEEQDKYRPTSVIPMPSGSSGGERSSVFDRLGRTRGLMGISHAEIEKKYSSDSASDKDGYDMVEYSVAQEKEAEEEVVSKQVAAVPVSHIGSKPSKILNISVNVNTWKPPGMVQETHSFSLENNKVSKAENTEVCFVIFISLPTFCCTCLVQTSMYYCMPFFENVILLVVPWRRHEQVEMNSWCLTLVP